ncbi:MAG: hypothetical protein RIR70_418 [Pseudomonadota bacterium]|jgi:HemY protein
MKALLWLFVLAGLAVVLSVLAEYNQGYVLLVAPPWRVEFTLNFFLVVLLAFFCGLYAVVRLIWSAAALPRQVAAFRARERKQKATAALLDAVRLMMEGRFARAMKQAAVAFEAREAPGLAALIAARAASRLREPTTERAWVLRAADFDSSVRSARLMTEAELALSGRRFDEARDRLDLLRVGGSRNLAAMRLSLRAAQGLGNWAEVARLTRQMEKYRALTPEQAKPLRRRAHLESIRERAGDATALRAYWALIPSSERKDARVTHAMARSLIAVGDNGEAQLLIEDALAHEWDSELAGLYGDCRGGDLLGRISHAEQWLLKEPRDARLLLSLGRLCMQSQLWGKAQSYFEASLALAPCREVHIELARLAEGLERGDEAARHYREAARFG